MTKQPTLSADLRWLASKLRDEQIVRALQDGPPHHYADTAARCKRLAAFLLAASPYAPEPKKDTA